MLFRSYMVILYTVALGLVLMWCNWYHQDFFAMIACVVYWGVIGGFVSSQRRMQNIPTDGDPLISVFGLDNAGYYLWLSPLLGAIFALTLTWMFIGGVLSGVAFPEFHKVFADHASAAAQAATYTDAAAVQSLLSDKTGLSFFKFAFSTLPRSSEDYGKLFVWAFLAGFAERLVPDSLDRLSAKLESGGAPALVKSGNNNNDPGTRPGPLGTEPPATGPKAKSAITSETLQDVMHTGEISRDLLKDVLKKGPGAGPGTGSGEHS